MIVPNRAIEAVSRLNYVSRQTLVSVKYSAVRVLLRSFAKGRKRQVRTGSDCEVYVRFNVRMVILPSGGSEKGRAPCLRVPGNKVIQFY